MSRKNWDKAEIGFLIDNIEKYEDRVRISKLIVKDHKIEDGITLCYSCHKSIHAEKRGELLGYPEKDNQQPSRGNVISFVPRKAHRLTGEDTQTNKPDTSAAHPISKDDDIVGACG